MKKLCIYLLFLITQLIANGEQAAEYYYVEAFNKMSDMLVGRDTLSIKKAVFLAEWAYYEGRLDYKTDFCDEIDRIIDFVRLFYEVNKLSTFKTGKQMALNEYFFRPYSGNGYKPYVYDYEALSKNESLWEKQFVSRVLRTHKGQCRSLPWMYKILAKEIGADVSLAVAPEHCYIMYKDEDNLTPEEWINLELTTQQMQPAWWIKEDLDICDSAVIVGTYMTPLTDIQTVALQMEELAFGYYRKFNRYDEFTFYCVNQSLEFYPMNPNAWIIRGKSLLQMIQNRLVMNENIADDYTLQLMQQLKETGNGLDLTFMKKRTEETSEY